MSRYVIIGGTTKAATTSLFNYLGDHPDICKCQMKESRFFIDRDYPVSQMQLHYLQDDDFNNLFQRKMGNEIRLDATPDYLYCKNSPKYISEALSDVDLIFILRHPVSRFISWYHFAKQNGDIPKHFSIEDFIDKQDEKSPIQAFRALDQGRYSKFIKYYYEFFNKSRIKILFYEDLKEAPQLVLHQVSDFLGIDQEFYDKYDFKIFNKSKTSRFPWISKWYRELMRLRKYVVSYPSIHRLLRYVKLYILDPIFNLANSKELVVQEITSQQIKYLEKIYENSNRELKKILELDYLWKK